MSLIYINGSLAKLTACPSAMVAEHVLFFFVWFVQELPWFDGSALWMDPKCGRVANSFSPDGSVHSRVYIFGCLLNICCKIDIYIDSQMLSFVITSSKMRLHGLYPTHFLNWAWLICSSITHLFKVSPPFFILLLWACFPHSWALPLWEPSSLHLLELCNYSIWCST